MADLLDKKLENINNEDISYYVVTINKNHYLLVCSNISNEYVVYSKTIESVYKSTYNNIKLSILIFAIVNVVAIIVGLKLSKNIIKPLKKIEKELKKWIIIFHKNWNI